MEEMMGIQGEWIHRSTGQKIHVRNSIIDGDQMIIITNVGQMSGEEFMRNYIQASNEIYDEKGNVIGNEKINTQQKQSKVELIDDQEYLIDDKPVNFDELNTKQSSTKQSSAKQSTTKQSKTIDNKENITNVDLIKKVFDKINKPEITINIKWDLFPKEQISTLVNFLDINIDDIAKYLCAEYVNVESVKPQIIDIIKKNI